MIQDVKENLDIDLNNVKRDFDECEDDLPIIVYLARYCCYTVDKRLRCKFCKELTTETSGYFPQSHDYSYVNGVSRGSLLHPSSVRVNIIMYTYLVINKNNSNEKFSKF